MQPSVAGHQHATGQQHRKINRFALVEQQRHHFGRRQVEHRAGSINAHIHRNGISIVEQRTVKGPARKIIGHGKRYRSPQPPGQHQRHHYVTHQTAAQ